MLLAPHATAGKGQNDDNIKAFVSDLNFFLGGGGMPRHWRGPKLERGGRKDLMCVGGHKNWDIHVLGSEKSDVEQTFQNPKPN